MRRHLRAPSGVLAGTLACLLVPGGALAQTPEGATAPPAVGATVEQCVVAGTPAGRSVTFAGQMETVAGTSRMAMQIVVLEHTAGVPGFRPPTAGIGAWQRSEAGVKIYKYVRQVTNLPGPAVFRALIRFRWLDEAGHVVQTAERRTPVCRQPGSTPVATGSTPAATMLRA
jgi:hypothetical protein